MNKDAKKEIYNNIKKRHMPISGWFSDNKDSNEITNDDNSFCDKQKMYNSLLNDSSISINDYYTVYNLTCSNRVDVSGSFHMWICKECANKLFAYCYSILADKNVELATQYVCSYLNLYWDVDLFYSAK